MEELLGRLRTEGKSPDAPSAHAPRRLQVLFLRLQTYFVRQIKSQKDRHLLHQHVLPSGSRPRDAGATLCMNHGEKQQTTPKTDTCGAKQDGQRILDMTLSSPIVVDQVRDSLLRFVQERVRLELLTSHHAMPNQQGRMTAHVEITHEAPETQMHTRAGELQARSASVFIPSVHTAEGVRASGEKEQVRRVSAAAGEAGIRPGAILSRASVQAQVDEIQQRLGLFVHS